MENTIKAEKTRGLYLPAWLRKLGVAGFCFFLAKGLLWLVVPYLLGQTIW